MHLISLALTAAILGQYVELSEADGLIFTKDESDIHPNRAAISSGRSPREIAARFGWISLES